MEKALCAVLIEPTVVWVASRTQCDGYNGQKCWWKWVGGCVCVRRGGNREPQSVCAIVYTQPNLRAHASHGVHTALALRVVTRGHANREDGIALRGNAVERT